MTQRRAKMKRLASKPTREKERRNRQEKKNKTRRRIQGKLGIEI